MKIILDSARIRLDPTIASFNHRQPRDIVRDLVGLAADEGNRLALTPQAAPADSLFREGTEAAQGLRRNGSRNERNVKLSIEIRFVRYRKCHQQGWDLILKNTSTEPGSLPAPRVDTETSSTLLVKPFSAHTMLRSQIRAAFMKVG